MTFLYPGTKENVNFFRIKQKTFHLIFAISQIDNNKSGFLCTLADILKVDGPLSKTQFTSKWKCYFVISCNYVKLCFLVVAYFLFLFVYLSLLRRANRHAQ